MNNLKGDVKYKNKGKENAFPNMQDMHSLKDKVDISLVSCSSPQQPQQFADAIVGKHWKHLMETVFFRTVSVLCFNTENHHSDIRKAVARYMCDNATDYATMIDGEMYTHIFNMASTSGGSEIWATEAKLTLTCRLLDINIDELTNIEGKYTWVYFKASDVKSATVKLHIHHTGNHFEPMLSKAMNMTPNNKKRRSGINRKSAEHNGIMRNCVSIEQHTLNNTNTHNGDMMEEKMHTNDGDNKVREHGHKATIFNFSNRVLT